MQEPNTNDRTRPEEPDSDSGLPSGGGIPSANQNASRHSESPKVRFGRTAGEVLRSGYGKNDGARNVADTKTKKKWKRSFQDVVLQEVIGINQVGGHSSPGTVSSGGAASTRRGILKLRGGETSLSGVADSDKQSLCFVNQAYVGDDDTDDVICSPPPPTSTVAMTDRSAFPYARRRSSEHGFAGLVELIFQRSSQDFSNKRDSHPFGRDGSVEAILEGDDGAPKRQNLNNAFSKLVVWIALLSFLVGSVLGLIFLSEMYNAKHRKDHLLRAALNETQNVT